MKLYMKHLFIWAGVQATLFLVYAFITEPTPEETVLALVGYVVLLFAGAMFAAFVGDADGS